MSETSKPEPEVVSPKIILHSTWLCMVQASGYNNGSTCNGRDPHQGWGCDWYFQMRIPAEGPGEVMTITL